jgi:hypothetical protein
MPASAQISSLSEVSPGMPMAEQGAGGVMKQHAAGHRDHRAARQRIHRIDEIGLLLGALEDCARAHAQRQMSQLCVFTSL